MRRNFIKERMNKIISIVLTGIMIFSTCGYAANATGLDTASAQETKVKEDASADGATVVKGVVSYSDGVASGTLTKPGTVDDYTVAELHTTADATSAFTADCWSFNESLASTTVHARSKIRVTYKYIPADNTTTNLDSLLTKQPCLRLQGTTPLGNLGSVEADETIVRDTWTTAEFDLSSITSLTGTTTTDITQLQMRILSDYASGAAEGEDNNWGTSPVIHVDPNDTLYIGEVSIWSEYDYTINFDANGGEDTYSPEYVTAGFGLELNVDAPSREGYTFKGWGLTSDATEVVSAGYVPTGDMTLYAIWEKELESVEWELGTIYSASGTNGSSTTRLRTVEYLLLSAYGGVGINSDYNMLYFVYDIEKTFLGTKSWLGAGTGFTTSDLLTAYPAGVYFRIAMKSTSESTLTLDDVTASGVCFSAPGAGIPTPVEPDTPAGEDFTYDDVGYIGGLQDGAIFDGKLFALWNGSVDEDGVTTSGAAGNVYDVATATKLGSLKLDKTDVLNPHANSVAFGSTYYDPEDKYPLLYVNIYNTYKNQTDRMEGTCCVYRIIENGTNFQGTLVQVIRIGFTEDSELWKSGEYNGGMRPYGNFVVDTDNHKLYTFVMRSEDNETRFFKFDLPALIEGTYDETYECNVVTLLAADIEDQFDTEYFYYMQGATYYHGKIISAEGFTNDNPAVRIVDLYTKEVTAIFYLENKGLIYEPEVLSIDPDTGILYYIAGSGTNTVEGVEGSGVLRKLIIADKWLRDSANEQYVEVADISEYRDTATGYTAPEKTGYVFAGWWKDDSGETPIDATTTSGSAWAKYVSEATLSVKAQTTAKIKNEPEKTKLRLVSTVDSLDYTEVGFEIRYNQGNKTYQYATNEVYGTITAIESGDAEFTYEPTVFSKVSKYFMAYTITNIDSAKFDNYEFAVQPYWVTLDGTTVRGVLRERLLVSDERANDADGSDFTVAGSTYTYTTDASAENTASYQYFTGASEQVSVEGTYTKGDGEQFGLSIRNGGEERQLFFTKDGVKVVANDMDTLGLDAGDLAKTANVLKLDSGEKWANNRYRFLLNSVTSAKKDTVYEFSFDYYIMDGAKASLRAYGWNNATSAETNVTLVNNLTGNGTATAEYTVTGEEGDLYMNAVFHSDSGVGYFWNFRVTEKGSDENLVNNAEFTETNESFTSVKDQYQGWTLSSTAEVIPYDDFLEVVKGVTIYDGGQDAIDAMLNADVGTETQVTWEIKENVLYCSLGGVMVYEISMENLCAAWKDGRYYQVGVAGYNNAATTNAATFKLDSLQFN